MQRIAFVEEEMPWEDNHRPVAVAVVAKDPLGLVVRLVLHFLVKAAAEHTSSCLVGGGGCPPFWGGA